LAGRASNNNRLFSEPSLARCSFNNLAKEAASLLVESVEGDEQVEVEAEEEADEMSEEDDDEKEEEEERLGFQRASLLSSTTRRRTSDKFGPFEVVCDVEEEEEAVVVVDVDEVDVTIEDEEEDSRCVISSSKEGAKLPV
jgi:hypothetical protein